eukprot:1083131_1
MNVRSAYLEYDGSGARMITGLDDSFNYWPVTAAEFLVEFRKIQNRECGIGTNDRTDLCSGLKTAFAEFENNGNVGPDVWAPKPERERKIIIFSNNEQENNLYCSNGKHICEEYEDKICEERKIIIFSNNEQENNLYCSNGKHICEEYEDKICEERKIIIF